MKRFVGLGFVLAGFGISTTLPALQATASGPVTVSVGDVTMTEGDSGTSTVRVPVELSAPVASTVKVPYTLSLGANASTGDVQLKVGTLSFAANVTSKYVNVTTVADIEVEPDQHITITLGTPVGAASIGRGTGEVVIVDDDAGGVNAGIEVSLGSVSLVEADAGKHQGSIPVTLSRPAVGSLTIKFTVDCATLARSHEISIASSGSIKFLAGQRTKFINFTVLPDANPELVESLVQRITTIIGSATVNEEQGVVEVIDDDGGLAAYTAAPVPGFQPSAVPAAVPAVNPGSVGVQTLIDGPIGGGAPQYPPLQAGDGGTGATRATISNDGRFVAFRSTATNLVPGDTNGLADIFVLDRVAGTLERITETVTGSQITSADVDPGNGWLSGPVITPDGRFVAYSAQGTLGAAVAATPWTARWNAYIHDRVTGDTTRVSVDSNGNPIGHQQEAPLISADGRWIVLKTSVAGEIAVKDRQTGTLTTVFSSSPSGAYALSDNGRFVVADSFGAECERHQLVAIDILTGATERIDVLDDGTGMIEMPDWYFGWLAQPSISSDGRYVTFRAFAWNAIPGMTGPNPTWSGSYDVALGRVFVRDRVGLSTTMIGDASTAASTGLRLNAADDASVVVAGSYASATENTWIEPGGATGTFGAPILTSYGGVTPDRSMLSGDGRLLLTIHYEPNTALNSGTYRLAIEQIR